MSAISNNIPPGTTIDPAIAKLIADLQIKVNYLEAVAANDTDAFSRIRDTLRKTGDMFLFGKPTANLMYITTKLYHENIMRILAYTRRDLLQAAVTGNPLTSSISTGQKFMCGIIEMENADGEPEYYITTSEAPIIESNPAETPNFVEKEQTLAALLEHCNMDVLTEGQNVTSNLKWRTFDDRTPSPLLLKSTAYDEVKELMFINPSDDGGAINYDDALWKKKYTVKIINSYTYLQARTHGHSFAPFKKYSVSEGKSAEKGPSASIECNNGSTCTEAKLFSYVKDTLGKTFADIKGFVVFWVGNTLPPNHHLASYCYSPSKPDENIKLDDLTAKCAAIFKEGFPEFVESVESLEEYIKIMKHVVQPIAMACPGCYSNYEKYRSGTYDDWDVEGCYKPINARTSRRLERNRIKTAKAKAAAASAALGASAAPDASASLGPSAAPDASASLGPSAALGASASSATTVLGGRRNTFTIKSERARKRTRKQHKQHKQHKQQKQHKQHKHRR